MNTIHGDVVLLKTTAASLASCRHVNDAKSQYGGRDVVGYGANAPEPKWPNGARVSFD